MHVQRGQPCTWVVAIYPNPLTTPPPCLVLRSTQCYWEACGMRTSHEKHEAHSCLKSSGTTEVGRRGEGRAGRSADAALTWHGMVHCRPTLKCMGCSKAREGFMQPEHASGNVGPAAPQPGGDCHQGRVVIIVDALWHEAGATMGMVRARRTRGWNGAWNGVRNAAEGEEERGGGEARPPATSCQTQIKPHTTHSKFTHVTKSSMPRLANPAGTSAAVKNTRLGTARAAEAPLGRLPVPFPPPLRVVWVSSPPPLSSRGAPSGLRACTVVSTPQVECRADTVPTCRPNNLPSQTNATADTLSI
jgi:hypothetical protein